MRPLHLPFDDDGGHLRLHAGDLIGGVEEILLEDFLHLCGVGGWGGGGVSWHG